MPKPSDRSIQIVVIALLVSFSRAHAEEGPDFNRDIRPILSKNCFACHGQDAEHREGGLRLDLRQTALEKTESGSIAIVPGDLEESELVHRISSDDDEEKMPPPSSGRSITPEQIKILKQWVQQGAPYSEHWSFVKPLRQPLPKIKRADVPQNEIDRWLLARLEKEGLTFSPKADRRTLIRRLSIDLRGLPATPEEVHEFIKDERPDAYERLVDRMLSDPAYGERWARLWLDLARYADSKGYGSDPLRLNMWRYRDWVIDAFNRNLPFDQFAVEQIAGDLLPEPTLEQRMATAFHRNTMTNTEGGTDDEEFRVAAIKDRVDTTYQVFMGLTMGCAKCHNHKFDPLSQKEYYQSFAFFNQTSDADLGDDAPLMQAPTLEMLRENERLTQELQDLKSELEKPNPELDAEQSLWEESLTGEPAWEILKPGSVKSNNGTILDITKENSILASGPLSKNDTYQLEFQIPLKGVTGFRLEALTDPSLPNLGPGRNPDGNFVLSKFQLTARPAQPEQSIRKSKFVRISLAGPNRILSLAEVQVFSNGTNLAAKGNATQSSTSYEGSAFRAIDGNTNGNYYEALSTTHTNENMADPWWEVELTELSSIDRVLVWNRTDGQVGNRLADFLVELLDEERKSIWSSRIAESPNPSRELSPNGEVSLAILSASADHSQPGFPIQNAVNQPNPSKSGWGVGAQIGKSHEAYFVVDPRTEEGDWILTVRLHHDYEMPGYLLGHFRVSSTRSEQLSQRTKVPQNVLTLVDQRRKAGLTPDQAKVVATYYRSIAKSLQPIRDRLVALEKSRPVYPTLPIMEELPKDRHRKTHVMYKGNFLAPGDEVTAQVPTRFHPLPGDAPNRLALARWIVDRENPLTARVVVNRFWSQLFGIGIVETEEDFGTQGELPYHPELLDWLALDLMENGWDIKRMLKKIVTSQAYRQQSNVTKELVEKDPRNRLLARAPRYRMEAEIIRDQALALSGLLSRKVGGPSVFPPQPDGLWQAAFNGERTWSTSSGDDKYRRGLYTFWRRTIPYPSMATFDAPSREICTIRRPKTNTPLQALVTLNDPVYVEAAQALARRIVREGGESTRDRARYGLELCLARASSDRQIEEIVKLYQGEYEYYQTLEVEAKSLAGEPLPEGANPADLAAWTVVANILLNLDGVLTRN